MRKPWLLRGIVLFSGQGALPSPYETKMTGIDLFIGRVA
jgi:hypothetical protein